MNLIYTINMTYQQLYSKISLLNSDKLKEELMHYLDLLLSKQIEEDKKAGKKIPQFGCAKGQFKISDDYNEPNDHFNEYLPA